MAYSTSPVVFATLLVLACGSPQEFPEPAVGHDSTPSAGTAETTGPRAVAFYPEVVSASATLQADGTWRFDVTLSSPYDSPQRYADAWRVLGPDGTELGVRILTHGHPNEQPFTRSLEGVAIPAGVTTVTVQGRDQISGWGGATFQVELSGDVDVPAVDDESELLAIHQAVIQAHLDGAVDTWLDLESEDYVSANRGEITIPTTEERRARRDPYLDSTTFSRYRDMRAPLVQVSADRTQGWLIAQVEIAGVRRMPDGTETPFEAVYAWIELYRKEAGAWKLVGNVSNARPVSGS